MLVGSWGFSSNKGVFAATSIENRKVLDVECRNILKAACKKRNDFQKKDPSAYAQWQNLQICKIMITVLLEEWRRKVQNVFF